MNREEVIAAVQQCANELGRNPTRQELFRRTEVRTHALQRHFGTFSQALRAAGLEPKGVGHRVETLALFRDWAAVARKIGKLPSVGEYQMHGRFSLRPYMHRFRTWNYIPEAFKKFVVERGVEQEWADMLAMVREQELKAELSGRPAAKGPRIFPDRPVYGPPLARGALAHEPVNEISVVFVFGMLAEKLGFVVTRLQPGFPDGEALREVEPKKWQRVRLEFEYESRNFLVHGHRKENCDLIVCWTHNWEECPEELEVVELRKEIG